MHKMYDMVKTTTCLQCKTNKSGISFLFPIVNYCGQIIFMIYSGSFPSKRGKYYDRHVTMQKLNSRDWKCLIENVLIVTLILYILLAQDIYFYKTLLAWNTVWEWICFKWTKIHFLVQLRHFYSFSFWSKFNLIFPSCS